MNAAKEIHTWLANPKDYMEGLKLYSTYGPRNNLKNVLLRKQNPKKLLYEMDKLGKKYPFKGKITGEPPKKAEPTEVVSNPSTSAKNAKVVEKPSEKKPDDNKVVDAAWRVVKETDPEEVKALKLQFKELLDERRILHMRDLTKDKTPEERFAPAMRILAIKPELDLIDDKLKHFQATGHLPVPTVITKADLNDRASIQDRIQTLKVYIRRTGPGKAMANPERYDYYMAELKLLQEHLAKTK
jgi:hypothetical protein